MVSVWALPGSDLYSDFYILCFIFVFVKYFNNLFFGTAEMKDCFAAQLPNEYAAPVW
jgi:hypothetical protein